MSKLTLRQIMSIQFEIIKLKDKYIESLEELIGKPEIIGKVESIKYINERHKIRMELIKLETQIGL